MEICKNTEFENAPSYHKLRSILKSILDEFCTPLRGYFVEWQRAKNTSVSVSWESLGMRQTKEEIKDMLSAVPGDRSNYGNKEKL